MEAIFRAHTRRELDKDLIARNADGWDDHRRQRVREQFSHGIDWENVRNVFNDKKWQGRKGESKALETVVCRGFWQKARKWQAGGIGTGTCEACLNEIRTQAHRAHCCDTLDV